MGNLNKVLLIGRLGQDPEKRMTSGGHSVVTLSLATSEKFTDKGGNKQEKTEWHKVVFWDRSADIIEQYLRKGSQLYVEGALQTREWQDKEGNKRWTTEIVARNFQFLDPPQQQGSGQSYNQGAGQPQSQQPQQSQQQQQPQTGQAYGGQSSGGTQGGPSEPPSGLSGGADFIEDDIPF